MADDAEKDTSRTVVKTYLPAYQRDEWDDHADDLDMSRSEFVKAMVQAGRRGFDSEPSRPDGVDGGGSSVENADSTDATVDRAVSIEDAVLEVLSTDEYLSWEELLAAISDDIETQLEETLQELQADDAVRYSGRHGGYTLER
jgi:hypothetical protein